MKQVFSQGRTAHFRFFKRTPIQDNEFPGQYLNSYTLLGLAKYTNSYHDIYRSFFLSFFKKTTSINQQTISRQHVSQFFIQFLDIIITHCQVGFQPPLNSTGTAHKIIQAFSTYNGLMNQKEKAQFKKFYSFLVMEIKHRAQNYSPWRKIEAIELFEKIKQARRYIKDKLNKILQWLESDYEKIDRAQYMIQVKAKTPEEKKKKVIYITIEAFKSIANMDLAFLYRKDVLKNFINANRSMWRIQINQIGDKTGYRIGEKLSEKEFQKWNDIIMPQPVKDRNPIMMRLNDFVPFLHQSNTPINLNHHQKQAIRELIKFIINYKTNTNLFFPDLGVKDLFWDQKQLKIIVSYNSLLQSAYGLNKNVKTFEMGIAFDNTPELISEKCHKEYEEQNEVLMRMKYYFPDTQKEIQQLTEEQKDEIARLSGQAVGKYSANQKLKIKCVSKQAEVESIHVWRLLQILYFISKNDSLSKYSFQIYRNKQRRSQRMSQQLFNKCKQQLYNNIKHNRELQTLLKPILVAVQQQKQLKQLGNHPPCTTFDFKLSSLESCLGITPDDDSLLDDLKDDRALSGIFLRQMISGNVSELLSQKKLFNAIPNVKKYTILIFIYLYEQLHFLDFQLGHNYKRRLKLSEKYKKMYGGIVLEEERLRRVSNCNKILYKFTDYMSRKDINTQYLLKSQNLKIANESHQKIMKIKQQSQKLKIVFNQQVAYEDRIDTVKQLQSSLKIKEANKDFQYFIEILQCIFFLKQAQIQINSITISQHKQAFFNNLLKRTPDSLRRKLIKQFVEFFNIELDLSTLRTEQVYRQGNNSSTFQSDRILDLYWSIQKNQQQFIEIVTRKINLPDESSVLLKILKKCNFSSEYQGWSQKIARIVESCLKKQLSIYKQKVNAQLGLLYQIEIANHIDENRQFYIGRDNQKKPKMVYYQFLKYKLAALIVLCITPDSFDFNREKLYNTFFVGFDYQKERNDKNGSPILQAKIQNIKTQILPFTNFKKNQKQQQTIDSSASLV